MGADWAMPATRRILDRIGHAARIEDAIALTKALEAEVRCRRSGLAVTKASAADREKLVTAARTSADGTKKFPRRICSST